MLSTQDFRDILSQIQYKNWTFYIGMKEGERPFLQIRFENHDNFTGKIEMQYCRKFFLSPHMVKSEVIRTAFKAVQMAEEHETHELFKYRDQPIYSPHFDVDSLHALCQSNQYDVRNPPYDSVNLYELLGIKNE